MNANDILHFFSDAATVPTGLGYQSREVSGALFKRRLSANRVRPGFLHSQRIRRLSDHSGLPVIYRLAAAQAVIGFLLHFGRSRWAAERGATMPICVLKEGRRCPK